MAIRLKAAIGSPCDPVHKIITSSAGYWLISRPSINVSSGAEIYPNSREVAKLASILRPKTAILRPVATATSVTCFKRETFDAKVAKIIRPSTRWIISLIDCPTTCSDFVNPGTSEFVLSPKRTRTPSSPI